MDDRELVRRVIHGDERAAGELIARFRLAVMGPCRRLRLGTQDCEDVFQDVFEKLFANDCARLRGWRGTGPLGAYIRQIANRQALDHIDARRRRISTTSLENVGDPVDETENPEAAVACAQLRRMAHEAISKLTGAQQAVIRTVVIEQMSYTEAASRLGISVNAVGVRLNAAKKALVRIIERDYPALRTYWLEIAKDLLPDTVNTPMGPATR